MIFSPTRFNDGVTFAVGEENKHDILFGDVFCLSYCGINVFLSVCRTSKNIVCVYELSKRRLKGHKEIISSRASKNPLIITKNNTWTKSTYWVKTDIDKNNNKILILDDKIEETPLYEKVLELGYQLPPTLIAYWLEEEQKEGISNFYWDDESYLYKNNVKQKTIKKIKNSA